MNIKDIINTLLSYIPPAYRSFVPLAGIIILALLALFGARYLTPELQAEIKSAIQTVIAPTATAAN